LLASFLIYLNAVDLYAYFSCAQKYGCAFQTLNSGKNLPGSGKRFCPHPVLHIFCGQDC
jgi:hypothetical protein